ncbi:MAG: hypothetical protein FWB84_01650 [Candidatus Bathyarchaeota archaeon]|uniref:TFIIB-type zinc ribbon-containing protein n=1 Tax=Candidatus Bathycorpusculum sp. TaxID=2994959 RepID=UPI002821BD8D|nr:hypothetical protein [Candidatus Termiticorpusculum sp.]MCL2257267.1 hypothetical protein [Candidatus Termiticorpusculum sp.]MCL2292600.1 hypothetical protein [Candidatus Termiticorpusculum sp.]
MVTKDSNKELSESTSLIKIKKAEIQTCPQCDSIRIIHDQESGEIVCMDCGFITQQKNTTQEPELKNIDHKQKQKHVKTNTPLTYTIQDKESTTVINLHNRQEDTYNKKNHPTTRQRAQVYHLRRWQRRVRVTNSTGYNLTFAISEITKTANILDLPKDILEPAATIYLEIVKKHLIKGYSTQSITAASLYLACKQRGLPQTLKELAQASKSNKTEIGRIHRRLTKENNYSQQPPTETA